MFEKAKKEIESKGLNSGKFTNENIQQNFISQSKILRITPDPLAIQKVVFTPAELDITYRINLKIQKWEII